VILAQEVTTYQKISSVYFALIIERGVKFDRSKRYRNAEGDQLGPGAYDPKLNNYTKQGGALARSKRDRSKTTDTIGPGAYKVDKSDFGQKAGYTIAGKYKEHGEEDRPGPAQYDYGKYLDKLDWGHGIKMSKAGKREQKPTTDIGPGGYDINDKFGGGYSFGKGIRDNNNDTLAPGPGQYSIKEVPVLSKIGRFGKQKRELNGNNGSDTAGPGAYNINIDHNGGFKFGRDKRAHDYQDEIPGPGAYKVKNVIPLSNLGSFGKQQRSIGRNSGGLDNGAGVGDYNPKLDNWCGGYSIGREKRPNIASNLENPGAGTYDLGSTIKNRTGYTFKRSNKDRKPDTTPGYYKPQYSVPDVPKYLLPPEPQRKIHL
jgi:Sperm-tail PG-rich repeat